jgi:hypothetical protein
LPGEYKMNKRKITIHKANEITRGGDNLSVHAKRAVNAIYYFIQVNANKGKKEAIKRVTYIPIPFTFLRKMLKLEKVESYTREIEKALLELQQPIQLNNFKDLRDGVIYNWYSTSFLYEAKWKIENNKRIAYIALTPLIKHLMLSTNNGNFTKLELIDVVNKLRTKYSTKLYEYLKSFKNYRYIEIEQKHMLKILGIEQTHKTYKHYAKLKTLIERQLKEIREKTDLKEVMLHTSIKHSKQKIYKIIINKNATKKTAAKQEIEELAKKMSLKF